jgi:transposase-like protein
MARPRGKISVVCQNENCSHYLKETGKNIIKRGFNRAKHRQYFCFNCNQYFVETKGTPIYQKKLKEQKIKSICRELVEKKGVRAISRTHHVNKNTVSDLLDDLANHAKQMTDYLVHDLKLETYEVDEILTFVKKNKKHLTAKQIYSLDQARQQLRHA